MSDILDSIKIVRMEPDHLNSVLRIEEQSFPTPWSKRAYMGELTRNNFAHYFVALLDRSVVGYIGLWIMVDESHITTLAVDPEYRRMGIAEKLIRYAAEYSKIWGAEKMVLEVRTSNFKAQNLYRRLGFGEVGIRKNYYSDSLEDAIVMIKRFDLNTF